ncbi:hypothetical protein CN514_21840 [Bacillus sp. AFS001701]|nr:hypothetical protein CN514_21840 [Bacillus sp. AFS001701]
MIMVSFGSFSVPILNGYINYSSTIPFFIGFIVGNILLIFGKINWNQEILTHFKKIIIIFIGNIPIAFTMFAIHIVNKNKIDIFPLYYLICFVILTCVYMMLLQRIYKKNINRLI